jgi:argininosuccinate lyase
MSTLWSGRFSGAPDEEVFRFGASFAFDRRLLEDDITGSLAWAAALAGAGVLSDGEVEQISNGLRAMLDEARANPALVDANDEDVHSFVERLLVARIGEAGKRLHTGRSRNEQVALDMRLYLRRRIPVLQERLVRAIAACVARAEAAGDALMPAYTHLRRAQPILVAHYWLAHATALRRDHLRLGQARDEAGLLTLGSGAIAGASYAIDTRVLAERLGFDGVVGNSLDATSDRDFVSSFLHATALAMVHVSRIAEDVIVFGSEEFGFFELDDRVATGSSLMPQKKNPDPMELVRGKAGRAIGVLAGWLTTLKGLPSGYNKDLQEDKEAVFDAEDTLAGSLAATATVIETLTVNRARTERAASGLLLATDVADYLVGRGMPFRSAHELVGGMVRRLLDEGRDFADLDLDGWKEFSPLFDADVRHAVTARASVDARRTPQSTSPAAVAASLAEHRAWIAAHVPGAASGDTAECGQG